jgi:hypothetical protein
MRIWPMALALLTLTAFTPLSAQDWEAGLLVANQTYPSLNINMVSGGSYRLRPGSKTITALRAGRTVLDLSGGSLQVSAMFQPFTTATRSLYFNSGNSLQMNYRTQQFGLGGLYQFKTPVALGAGLDVRVERLAATTQFLGSSASAAVNLVRPWARANAGYAFSTASGVKPFIKLELAAPLVNRSLNTSTFSGTDLVAAMAPRFQAGIYLGVNF